MSRVRRVHLVVEVRGRDGKAFSAKAAAHECLENLYHLGQSDPEAPRVVAGSWGRHRWVFDDNPIPPATPTPAPEPVVLPPLEDPSPAQEAEFRRTLGGLVRWYTRQEQSDGAVESHLGSGLKVEDPGLYLSMSRGYHNSGPHRAVLVVRATGWVPDPQGDGRTPRRLTGPWCGLVVRVLADQGVEVVHQWNGAGCDSGSWGLALDPHPTLGAAFDRYVAFDTTGHDLLIPPVADP